MKPLILLLAAWVWGAPTPASEGQKLYDAGDFSAAATWYRQALDQDPSNAGLHYNLGNCLFKSGRIGPAIAAYQRAFDLLPRDADIRQNLDFALRRAGEELAPPGVPPLLFAAFHMLARQELLGLQWLFCWLAFTLWAAFFWRYRWRSAVWGWALAATVLWLGFGSWWLALRGSAPARQGVIIAAPGEIRSGPGENFAVSFTAPEGRRVEIISEDGEWLEIGIAKEGAKGWIRGSSVESVWNASKG
jgi:tetratricopeptide (TPR) repeat protein